MRRFDEVGLNREAGIGEVDGSARRIRTCVINFVKSYWSWATGKFNESQGMKAPLTWLRRQNQCRSPNVIVGGFIL